MFLNLTSDRMNYIFKELIDPFVTAKISFATYSMRNADLHNTGISKNYKKSAKIVNL